MLHGLLVLSQPAGRVLGGHAWQAQQYAAASNSFILRFSQWQDDLWILRHRSALSFL